MKAVAIIPARYASTRFPAKALATVLGKPMILAVYDAVRECGLFDKICVATDSVKIRDLVIRHGGCALMTSGDHQSGSDRVAEAARGMNADVIVNVQGDEPLIQRDALAALLDAFRDERVQMASLMTPIDDPVMLGNPNCVKVVTGASGDALYFSRSPIPFDRDGTPGTLYHRHIGVYVYRRETLLRFVSLPQGKLERIEKLEQLRALEHGIPIRMVETSYQGIGIDTPEDLALVEQLLSQQRTQS